MKDGNMEACGECVAGPLRMDLKLENIVPQKTHCTGDLHTSDIL